MKINVGCKWWVGDSHEIPKVDVGMVTFTGAIWNWMEHMLALIIGKEKGDALY